MSFSRLELMPKVSKTAFFSLLLLHVLAVGVLFVLQVWVEIRILLFFLIAYSGYETCWQSIALKKPTSIKQILFSQGDWKVVNQQGEAHEVFLLGDTYLSSMAVILHFCFIESRKRLSIVLPRDSVDRQLFRRLKVILKNDKINEDEGMRQRRK